jgi:hypothetical protein
MKTRVVRAFHVPSLLLAAALQVMPIVRAALPVAESAANILAVVFRWAAGAAAALGGVQAVSGASTVITNPLSTNIVEGQPFSLRLTTAPDQAHYWSASGLPAGLSLVGTSGSTLWQISGTPTVTGTFNVTLTAKDQANSGPSLTVTGVLVLNISAGGGGPPTIVTQPASQSVSQGQNATFFVVAGGSPPLSYQWRFQGANLSGQTTSNLVITSATSANAGNYAVVVSNNSGSVTSAVVTLTVNGPAVPPAIITQPQSRTNLEGDLASFSVAVSSSAPVTYQWRKANVNLSDNGHFSGTGTNVLSIVGVQTNDAGTYSVVVANSSGSVTSQVAVLTVTASPGALAPITVLVSGVGSVSPDYNGQLLRIGGSYMITATPGQGYTFSNWSGSIDAATPVLNFTMQSNLVLQANFVRATVASGKGVYHGLFYEAGGVSPFSSGFFQATTTSRGSYSAALTLLGHKYRFSGRFDSSGGATHPLARGKLNPLTVKLQLDALGSDQVRGQVSDGTWSADLLADRAVYDKKYLPAPQSGVYTLLIPGTPGAGQSPSGNGYGTVTVDGSGRVRFVGRLADGTRISESTSLSKSGDWPFYVSFFSGEGSVLGWLEFTNRATDDINGLLSWNRLPQPSARLYPGGFAVLSQATGAQYMPPASGGTVPNFNGRQISLTAGNLASNLVSQILSIEDNPFRYSDFSGLTLRISPATGLFTGGAQDPVTGRSISFQGAILQKQNLGGGFFLGPSQGGNVLIAP